MTWEGSERAADRPHGDGVLILVNPRAGRRSAATAANRLGKLLRARGFRVETHTDLDQVCERANRWHETGALRALVGVGGDGTAAELANRTAPGVPLAMLARGTANLMARCVGWGADPEGLAETISSGRLLRVDTGRANGRLFLLMATCGLDAEVVKAVHLMRYRVSGGRRIGYLSYIKPLVDSIRKYRYPELRVQVAAEDGRVHEGREPLVCQWALVFNLPPYGWGLPLAPDAVPTDGELDLYAFLRGSVWRGLVYAAGAQFGGWHRRLRDCRMVRVRRLRISSGSPVPYQLDGDPGGQLPLEIEVVPARLTIVVPAGWSSATAGWEAAESSAGK